MSVSQMSAYYPLITPHSEWLMCLNCTQSFRSFALNHCTATIAIPVLQNTNPPVTVSDLCGGVQAQDSKHASKQASKQTNKQESKQASKQASNQASKQASKQESKKASKQANKQTSKKASKQASKQA